MLIGIDEVGRGAWAGPLLVVACATHGVAQVELKDSKLLSKRQREALIPALKSAFRFGEGWVNPDEIDKIGLTEAMRLGVTRALGGLKADTKTKIIMDGTINYCDLSFSNVVCEAKADAKYPVVSAASIYAKVLRDQKMTELSLEYPDYGFEGHVGYGTEKHSEALKKFGVSKIHRLSYKPVKEVLINDNNQHRKTSRTSSR